MKNRFPNIELDKFIVMPNHFHGIIQIVDTKTVGADLSVCPENTGGHSDSPLHTMIQWLKTMSTNEYIRNVKSNHWTPFKKNMATELL